MRAFFIWYLSFNSRLFYGSERAASCIIVSHLPHFQMCQICQIYVQMFMLHINIHIDCYHTLTIGHYNLIDNYWITAQLFPRLCLSRWNLNIGWILICCVVAVVSRWLFVQQTPTLLCCQTHERDRYWLSLHLHIYPLYFVCFQQSIITGWLIKISQHKQLKHWQLGSALLLARTRWWGG